MASYNEPLSLVEQHEDPRSPQYIAAYILLAVILLLGILCAVSLAALPPTFNGEVDVATLETTPDAYTTDNADGAAYIIVALNNAKTVAKNICFSVVFNFRGYDTMGESFILIAALSGSLCILRIPKHGTPGSKKKTDAKRGKR